MDLSPPPVRTARGDSNLVVNNTNNFNNNNSTNIDNNNHISSHNNSCNHNNVNSNSYVNNTSKGDKGKGKEEGRGEGGKVEMSPVTTGETKEPVLTTDVPAHLPLSQEISSRGVNVGVSLPSQSLYNNNNTTKLALHKKPLPYLPFSVVTIESPGGAELVRALEEREQHIDSLHHTSPAVAAVRHSTSSGTSTGSSRTSNAGSSTHLIVFVHGLAGLYPAWF